MCEPHSIVSWCCAFVMHGEYFYHFPFHYINLTHVSIKVHNSCTSVVQKSFLLPIYIVDTLWSGLNKYDFEAMVVAVRNLWTDLEASLLDRQSSPLDGPGRFSQAEEQGAHQVVELARGHYCLICFKSKALVEITRQCKDLISSIFMDASP
jgi:hypothetical protein